ncbi:MAG: hypothetical protein SFV55_25390 [Haliscomenobacter sp.]|uniref:hypothetical protein n=1 Tax=Haliscomenobacter sp. TaxID=2717303 RepID=UPI0029B465FD|nr:hypothetical protein [Haliscomenobacter sp.]MDX2071792.1 hypothetical protein [Haliscomenobacter sp.]
MLTKLKRQNVEFYPFLDSLKLEEQPQKYNPNYECLSLVKLNDHAPAVLWGFWYCWRTLKVDSIGYVAFHDFFELAGVDKSKAIIVTYANRERVYFKLLTFEKEEIKIWPAFLVLENELEGTFCHELDYDSTQFEGELVKEQLSVCAKYGYHSHCEDIEDIKKEAEFMIQLPNLN